MRVKKAKYFVVIGIFTAMIVLIISISVSHINFVKSSSSPSIEGIECEEMEQLGYHIHAHVDLFVNGNKHTVPALIGITNNCFYWLHTHDDSGVIHIESPIIKNFTLSQFLKIWKSKYNDPEIANIISNNTKEFSIYLNGKKTLNTNIQNVIFHPHDEIVIVIGNPPLTIPSKYSFENGL